MISTSVHEMQQCIAQLGKTLEDKSLALASTEMALARTKANLEEVTQIYQTTFDLAAIDIVHITLEGRWFRVNPFLCEMLGYSKEEL